MRMDVKEKLAEIVKKAAYSSLPSNTEDFHLNMFVANLLSHGVTVQEWIPVDERLPEEKANCIAYYKHAFCDDENHVGICVCFYDGNEFEMDFLHKVTHWMPLPQPPKGE